MFHAQCFQPVTCHLSLSSKVALAEHGWHHPGPPGMMCGTFAGGVALLHKACLDVFYSILSQLSE